jgi:hypothetical protein
MAVAVVIDPTLLQPTIFLKYRNFVKRKLFVTIVRVDLPDNGHGSHLSSNVLPTEDCSSQDLTMTEQLLYINDLEVL